LSNEEDRRALISHIADLREKEVLSIIRGRLEDNDDPLGIIKDCEEGMRIVGERYERGEYFIAGLIMAGEIFRQAVELTQPLVKERVSGHPEGSVLIGTAKGDIHDIGKNIVVELLGCYGFKVYDLGVDVPPEEFLEQASELKPDIIGISCLITSVWNSMRETVMLLKGEREQSVSGIPIIIGGSLIDDNVCNHVGADYWVNDAMTGLQRCRQLISGR